MTNRGQALLGIGVAAIVLICVVLAVVVIRYVGPVDEGPDAATLLLTTAEWKGGPPDLAGARVDAFDHADLSGVSVQTRRWTLAGSGDDLVVRQDVQRERNAAAAHRAFTDDDPSDGYREDLGGAQKIGSAGAAHADEAVGYCVPEPAGCYVIDYWLRYGPYLVDLSLVRADLQSGDGVALLAALDSAMAAKVG
jgi:hypothetical protein